MYNTLYSAGVAHYLCFSFKAQLINGPTNIWNFDLIIMYKMSYHSTLLFCTYEQLEQRGSFFQELSVSYACRLLRPKIMHILNEP